tara:strand:- start:294 stop:992 length:699 start_codon:yes stop_codon:yes gene_type:complete
MVLIILLLFFFIYFLNFINDRFEIFQKVEKIILNFCKKIFLENKKIQLLLKNRYFKKISRFSFVLGKPILNAIKSYLKGWAETFKLNKNSSRREFIEFVIIDLILIILLILKGAGSFNYTYLLFYNVMALFPRIFLLIRRLKARNLTTKLSFLIFFPVFGWFITWNMGSRNAVVIDVENEKATNSKKSINLNLTNILLSILVILLLTFGTIYIINESNTSGIKCRGNICKSY